MEWPNPDIWQITQIVIRCILYLSVSLATGSTIYILVFGMRSENIALGVNPVFWCSSVAAILFAAIGLLIQVGMLADDGISGVLDTELIELLWQGPPGTAFTFLCAGLLLMGISNRIGGMVSKGFAALGVVLSCAFFVSTGHASGDVAWVMTVLILVHFGCVSFWVGALLPLRRAALGAVPLGTAADLSDHFGKSALPIVIALLAAGLWAAWLQLGSIRMVFGSEYGLLLLGKVGFVGLLLLFAALNKLRIVPKMRAGDPIAARALARSINYEIGLVVLVFIVTATLTSLLTPPAYN